MRAKKTTCFSLLLLFSLFILANSANASAIAECTISVDWSTLNISGDAYETNSYLYNGLNSEGWINGPDSTNSDYFHDQSAWVSDNLSFAVGDNTATMTSSSTSLVSSSSGSADYSGWINGNNHRGVYLGLLAGGSYTFSVDYQLEMSLDRESAADENASIYTQISFWLTEGYPGSNRLMQVNDPYSLNFTLNELAADFTYDGTLTLTIEELASGAIWAEGSEYDRYWFETHLHASVSSSSTYRGQQEGPAPVPEPATLLLLGIGLAGLAWYGGKRKIAQRCKAKVE